MCEYAFIFLYTIMHFSYIFDLFLYFLTLTEGYYFK